MTLAGRLADRGRAGLGAAPMPGAWRRLLRGLAMPAAARGLSTRALIRAISAFLVFYAAVATLGPVGNYAKYLFTAIVIASAALLAVEHRILNVAARFPLAQFALFALGVFSFTRSVLVPNNVTTYSSALIPLLVIAAPMLIPRADIRLDAGAALLYLERILGLAAFCHVLWQVAGALYPDVSPSHERTFILVFFFVLAGLRRKAFAFSAALALILASLALRPSSTLAFASTLAILGILAFRMRRLRLLRGICHLTIVFLIVGNLAMFGSAEVAEAIFSVEPYMKEDVLDSQSNNAFRLGVLEALRDTMASNSILIGKGFLGGVDVSTEKYLTWNEDSQEPIHSDFLIVLDQGGLIGYALFSSLFVGLALLCGRAAARASATGMAAEALLFHAVLVFDAVFALYISFNPIMQKVEMTLFFLAPAFIATILGRDLRPSHGGARAPARSIAGARQVRDAAVG
jgi:hypothetical protein